MVPLSPVDADLPLSPHAAAPGARTRLRTAADGNRAVFTVTLRRCRYEQMVGRPAPPVVRPRPHPSRTPWAVRRWTQLRRSHQWQIGSLERGELANQGGSDALAVRA